MTGTQALVFVAYSLALGGPSLAAAAIGDSTPVQFGMVLGGIATAIAMTWKIRGWVSRIEDRLDRIEGKRRHSRREPSSDN